MKLAICDDEKDIRNYIEKCVRKIDPGSDVVQYADGREILKPGFDADILFLDIQMPDVDGMRAARILRDTGSKTIIVFVTAVEEFVFQAFDVGAVQYILKPFDKNKLMETIRKAISLAKEQHTIADILAAADPSDETDPRYIMVKSDGVNTRIVFKDIAYAEVFDRRVVLHMSDRECIEYYGRMTELERVAGDGFFRPHRAYLINLGFVSSYDSKKVLVLGSAIPVARGKYRELVKAYMSYYTRKENL